MFREPWSAGSGSGSGSKTVTLVSHDSFNASPSVLKEFTKQTGYTVKVLKSGDAVEALNKEILTKGSPQGDVFFGVDNTTLSRALDNDLFTPYEAKGLGRIPEAVQLDKDKHRVTPVDYGEICVNYDRGWFEKRDQAPPESLDDLADPEYKNLLVTPNAATSSPGLGFLLATVEKYGGKFLIRGGKFEKLEGDWHPTRVVLLEFPSLEQAKRWYNSEEYREPKALRFKTAKTNLILVEGAS